MRCILLLLDGLGDRSHPILNGQTPLQAAHTPNLDRLAAQGMNGLFHPHLQGTALPSELAHFLMFGYPFEEFPGRGAIEALGEGLAIREGDVALLARIFSVIREGNSLLIRHENPELGEQDCRTLQGAIGHFRQNGMEAEFLPTRGIGGFLRLRGEVCRYITDSNPISEGRPLLKVLPWRSRERDPRAHNTARFLNDYLRWSHRTLTSHPLNLDRLQKGLFPINAVGTQRAGMLGAIPPFSEKWGLKGLFIASGALYQGLGQLLGMETCRVRDTNDPSQDLRERLQIAYQASDHDFIHVHTKIADQAGHSRDPLLKKQAIEAIDRALDEAAATIAEDEEVLFIVTADHSTAASGSMIHSGETVPLVMIGKYLRRDTVQSFDEISCAAGSLNLVRGGELMYLILNFMDRGKLWGLMDAAEDQPFSPGFSTPLTFEGPT